jgi:serine/threonine protein kinase
VNTVAQDVSEMRLEAWLEATPRSWRDVLSVFIEVGEKLAAAHAAGVLYQEITLDQIVVLPDGHADVRDLMPARLDVPKVGLGSLRTAAIPLEQRLAEMKSTESVAYMAPEQFRGRSADARSNQFSFGVGLYRALYRHAPFDHEWAVSQAGESRRTPLGSIHFDLLIKSFDRATLVNLAREVLSGNLRPSPEDTDVPVWLDSILRRILQTDPDERYPSMRHLLDALTKGAQGVAPGLPEPAGPWSRWSTIGGIGLVALLVALVLAWLGRAR